MKKQALIVTLFCTIFISSCANLNSIYRMADINKGGSPIIDAKQRAIITSPSTHTTYTAHGRTIHNYRRVCAEPSPDAMSVFASSSGFGASVKDKAKVFGKLASSESGANIGLRTHSIQLLRDSFYRTCEAFLNFGIDNDEYALQLRRFQSSMIAMITIEQLTGVTKAPAVVLTAAASNETGEVLNKLIETRTSLETKKNSIESKKTKALADKSTHETKISETKALIKTKKAEKKALDADGDGILDSEADGTTNAEKQTKWDSLTGEITDSEATQKLEMEKKTKVEKNLKVIEVNLTSTESIISSLDKSIQSAETGNLRTTAAGLTIIDNQNEHVDGRTRRHIADIVGSIASQLISTDLGPTRCFDYLKSVKENQTKEQIAIVGICKDILTNHASNAQINIKRMNVMLDRQAAEIRAIRQKNDMYFENYTSEDYDEDEDEDESIHTTIFPELNSFYPSNIGILADNPSMIIND